MRVTTRPTGLVKGDMIVATGWVFESYFGYEGGVHIIKIDDGSSRILRRGEIEVERPVAPEAVAVDTYGGYVFSNGEDGKPFTIGTATAFAKERNAGLKVPTYKVFMLTGVKA